MDIQTCKFVDISDVFSNCQEAFAEFCNQDNFPFTWGDNNRSLITSTRLLEYVMDNFNISNDEEDAGTTEKEWVTVTKRLRALESNIYIDLEN